MRYLAADQALFVLIGPSAVGKTTLAKRLADAGLVEVTPSWTTRPRRANEADDFEHLFCSEEEFDAALAAGRFLDTVQPFNDKARYGLPRPLRPADGKVPLILLRSFVLPKLFAHYPHPIIYQIESSKRSVSERLGARARMGVDNADRLALYEQEIADGRRHASRIFQNDDFERLTSEVTAAIHSDLS